MLNKTLKLDYIECFSVNCSSLESKETDEFFLVGHSNKKKYIGFLYVDFGELPLDTVLDSAKLRIFVKKAEIEKQSDTLYFQPLIRDLRTFGIIQSTNQQDEISISIPKDYYGWLEIDMLDTVENWCKKTSKNYGLIIRIDKLSKSRITFSNSLKEREMILEMTEECWLAENEVQVIQKFWKFTFYRTEISPPINISLIKQSTFFVTNQGKRRVGVSIETSTDLFHWVTDSRKVVEADDTIALVAKYYGKYYRIKFYSNGFGKVKVVFIGQLYSSLHDILCKKPFAKIRSTNLISGGKIKEKIGAGATDESANL